MSSIEVMNLSKIVPVIAIEDENDALFLVDALLEGGIVMMEITLRTEAGLKSIEKIAKKIPQMHVGAGTVVDAEGFKKAVDHGSEFIFSPGISEELMKTSKELSIALIPGVGSASEIMLAQNNGFYGCKLFPASVVGGVDALKAFSGPFGSMKFCPTGGVNLQNMNEFLSLSNVLCVGGSWIVPKAALEQKNFKEITRLAKEAMDRL